MLKFFRKIRQNLLSEGKTGKYLKYAIGEIVLVVIGILIALSINNWNENRKLLEQRQQLIALLLEDFEYNRETLKQDMLPLFDSRLNDMQLFSNLIEADKIKVSTDSLRHLATSFFLGSDYNANLTSLNEATSSGKLSLIGNKELLNAFTLLMQDYDSYQHLNEEFRHSYFNGSLWEIRKIVPPDFLAGTNTLPGINHTDYIKIINQPLAKTALYNSQLLNQNKRRRLSNMLKTTNQIISILREMKNE